MGSAQEKISVLVAEDSATQAKELTLILQSEGFTVNITRDGQQALTAFETGNFDLVLTDIMMPGMSGYDLCRHIKNSSKKNVPVILLTSLSESRDIIEGLSCGADNFITKPCEPEYLIARIKNVLSNIDLRSKKAATSGLEVVFAGEKFEVSGSGEQILDFLVSTFEDYSRVKQQEHETRLAGLKASEANLRIAVEAAPNGMLMVNNDGIIMLVNSQVEKLFAYDRDELINQKMDILMPERYHKLYLEHQKDFIDQPDPVYLGANYDLFGLRKNRTEFPVEIGLNSLYTESGLFILISVVDITEKKAAEKRVSEFYSTVSHELRTPLTSIRGSLGLIEGGLAGEISPKAAQLIEVARSESDRLIRLINDILDIRKIEAGKLELKKANIDLSKIVERAIEGINWMAQDADLTVSVQMNCTGQLNCDEDRIIQVLVNLISNAIKFSPRSSEIIVRLEQVSEQVIKFLVIDQGFGIPKEQMSKLFGQFQQIDSSDSRKQGGTGLGLAISKAIVEEHNGTIGVESEFGKTSTFWFELPGFTKATSSSRLI